MLGETRRRIRILLPLLFTFLVVVLAAVSVFLLVHAYLANPVAFNSDNLLCSDLCDDLLHRRDVTGWHLPGAPYLFPDLVVLTPCQLLTSNIVAEFLAYCFMLHLCLLAVLIWLGRLSGLGRWQALRVAGCGVILLAVVHLNKDAGGRTNLLVHPGSHAGALLAGLFLLVLTIRSLRYGQSWLGGMVFLLAGGMGAFSDKLVVAQLLTPLALALVALAARRVIRVKQAGGQLALLGALLPLSLGIKLLLQRLGFQFLELETPLVQPRLPDLVFMLRRLYHGIEHQYLLCTLIPLHLLAALLVLRTWSRQPAPPPGVSGLHRDGVMPAALTFVLSPLCILGALFALSMAHHPAIDRYSLSCRFLPCLLLPLLLCWLPGRTARIGRLLVQLGVVLFAVQRAAVLLPEIDRGEFDPPYPPLAQALDRLVRERGPMRGLAGFWLARSTRWFTREHVVINPLSAMGEPWFHASNPARFLADDGAGLRVPVYQFLLVRPGDSFCPPASVLTLHFGVPSEKIAVGTDEIWLYDSLRSSPFDRFLRSRLAERLRTRRPYTGPVEPTCLACPKANLTPSDTPGTIALEAGQPLEVRFAEPVAGRLLDVGANSDNCFDLDFYRGAVRLGRLFAPAVPWTGASYGKPGTQSRLIPLPAGLRDRLWDRIVMRPRPGAEEISLGHLLVFAEDVPGLAEEEAATCPARLRLEGESLLPINPGTPFSDDADPAASSGRVRRAAVDFACPFSFTPYLFLRPGRYRLEFAVKVGENSIAEEVARLNVCCYSPPVILAERHLRGSDFPTTGGFTTQTLTFQIAEGMERVQFGIVTSGRTPIALDYIDLIAEPPDSLRGAP